MLPSVAPGPPAVYSSAMTSWGMNGTLLYGGCLALGCHRQSDATWAFQASASCLPAESSGCWTDVGLAAATRGPGPPGLASEGLADDAVVGPANGTIVLFGGLNQSCAECARQDAQSTWFYDGWSWTNATGPLSETAYPPGDFQLAFLFWDPVSNWVYAYGSPAGASSPTELWGTDTLVWVNDSGLVTSDGPAYGSSIASGFTESEGSELPALVFGGNQSSGRASSSTWAFELGLSVTPGVTSSAPETNQSVGFFATVSGGDSPTGAWAFGDGGTSNAVNLTHAYRRAGVYLAQLNVTDAVGVQSGSNVSLSVHTFAPGLSVPTAVDAGYPASFELNPSDGTPPYSATWLFSGSAPQAGLAVAHVFSSPGNYSIEVSTQDGTGTIVNLSRTVPVSDRPALFANATPSRIDVGVATQLVAFVTGGAAPFSYLWRLPDGRTSRLPSVSFTPETTGVMNATVNASDAAGVELNASVELVVSPGLSFTASAVPVGVFSGRAMAFSVSITGGVAPYHYSWLFGDGASSSLAAPQHTFALSAVYLVNIWVNDSGGRSDHELLAARVPHTSGGLIWDIESLSLYQQLAIIGAVGAGLLVLILLAARKVRAVERRTNAPGSGPGPRRSNSKTPEPPGPKSR